MSASDDRTVSSLPQADRPNIDQPRFDQNEYWGRAKHFLITTNPLNLFCTGAQLEAAKKVVMDYRSDKVDRNLTVDELWRAKNVYDSAFHPDTGEKMVLVGRMSAQVPMNMAITGSMLTFYKSTPAVVFWQWFNQTFNATVNYTNRSGDSPIPQKDLALSYVSATGGALVTALGLNQIVKSLPPLIGRFVPLCAVCAANAINIPLMRRLEWQNNGVTLLDSPTGKKVASSKYAAKWAVTQVTFSRCLMAMPGMIIPPIIMNSLMQKSWFARRAGLLSAPLQISMVGLFLVFTTPLCCALFPQMSSIKVTSLEPEVQAAINSQPNPPKVVYYNKGL